MIMNPRVCSLLIALLCFPSQGAYAFELTETQALRMLRESPYHRELRARVEIARARARRGTLYPNPTVSATFEGAGRTDFYMFEQPLAVNGRRSLLRQAGESSVSAEDSRADHELRRIEAELRQTFHRLAFAQEREETIRSSIAELRELVRILRERESAGEGSKFDRLRAEREIVERETERAAAEAAIAESQARLGGMLGPGVDADRLVANGTLEPGYPLPALNDAMADGLESRNDYRVETDRLRELDLKAEAAERLRVPNPVVSGGLKRAEVLDRSVSGPVLAISVGLPLFNKGQIDRQLAEAEAVQVRARREILENRIQAEVRSAYAALRIRRRIADEYEAQSGSRADEIRRIAEVAYREGELGILELLDSYRVAQSAALRLLELRADAKLAEVEFDWAVAKELLP